MIKRRVSTMDKSHIFYSILNDFFSWFCCICHVDYLEKRNFLRYLRYVLVLHAGQITKRYLLCHSSYTKCTDRYNWTIGQIGFWNGQSGNTTINKSISSIGRGLNKKRKLNFNSMQLTRRVYSFLMYLINFWKWISNYLATGVFFVVHHIKSLFSTLQAFLP